VRVTAQALYDQQKLKVPLLPYALNQFALGQATAGRERTDRADRADRADTVDRADRANRTDTVDMADMADRAVRADK
jgi:hypothetical protein